MLRSRAAQHGDQPAKMCIRCSRFRWIEFVGGGTEGSLVTWDFELPGQVTTGSALECELGLPMEE